jgi:alginate O-acetyltransferase complex protein AlgI
MLFSSISFIFWFLPLFMIVYRIVPARYRNAVLVAGSLIFYGIGEPCFVLLLIFSILVNFWLNKIMFFKSKDQWKNRRHKLRRRQKRALAAALIFDLGFLFLFKYWDFAASTFNMLAGGDYVPVLSLALPLGISFYTFQMISYQVDCYRGNIQQPASLLEFAAYISMFPQLIAGPIVRYGEIADRMRERAVDAKGLENGLKLFTVGLGLKVLLANQIGTLWNAIMTAGAGNLHLSVAWLGAFAYSFQIYYDFWGYSLMAMGLGEMLGFQIPRNFHNPYVSKSISEFWRRWHITLGTWFREYVYIPLGGSRQGAVRTVCNLFVVWTLTGLWHGASWNFVLWGVLFFLLLAIEKLTYGKWMEKTRFLGHIYVLILIPVTWVVFAITDMGQLAAYLGNLVGVHSREALAGVSHFIRYLKEYGVLLLVCALFATPYPARWYRRWKDRWFAVLILLAIFWLSVHEIIVGSNNPFLYFRF